MAELDAFEPSDPFEPRFAAAYRRYVDEAPMEVDAAAVAHAAAVAPGARGLALPGTLRPLPAPAWLLLLGLLLAALGGMLVVGSQVQRKLPAVLPPIGQVFECPPGATPDKPGPADQARPPMSYVAPMAFDRRAGRIVLLANGYGTGPQTWTLDVCTNTWTMMHPDRVPGPWRGLVYDEDSDVTITIDTTTRVWVYDLEADTWTAKGLGPMSLQRQVNLVYDSASGDVVVMATTSADEADPWELWTYDVETDTWTPIRQSGVPVGAPDHAYQGLAYDTSVKKLVWYDLPSVETWLFDIAKSSWSRSGAVTPKVNLGWGGSGGEIAYDETTRQTVVYSRGRVIAYDATADRWEILAEGWDPDSPAASTPWPAIDRFLPWTVYDPVNERLVVYGGQYPVLGGDITTWVQADDVWSFDPETSEWSVLLEASKVQPAPS